METTSPTMQATVQAPSAMPTASAPGWAAPQPMSVPLAYQASAAAPAVATAPMAYQMPVGQQALAQPANPWQTAFQALSASLNTNNQSPAQAAYSAYQTPTPQTTTAAGWGSTASTAAQTSNPQASANNLEYSKATVLALLAAQRKQIENETATVSDAYLSEISDLSLEVLEHFGAEAPALLNQYACAVEDALIEQVQRGQSLSLLVNAAAEERGAMNLILTDPDVLADYVNEFFGPNGPYPTETPDEKRGRLAQENRNQMQQELNAYQRNTVPSSFQRPQMDMPTPGRAAQAAGNFWGNFGSLMDNNPENAWKFLAQAPQGALQTKMLVQDL